MNKSRFGRPALSTMAIGFTALAILPSSADAEITKTVGNGQSVNISWTEYDPDDLLGLPGNVHLGYLYAESGPFGSFFYGNITDFDCEDGETPWGGGHDFAEEIVEESADVAEDAAEDAIEEIIDSGETIIDGDVVVDAIQTELANELDDVIEEFPACDYIQDRFLEGQDDLDIQVDSKRGIATIIGRLNVTSGGHGEPGDVLASPPINVTITGGSWENFEYSYDVKGQGYRYSSWQRGKNYNGGDVTGAIGAMGFDDDADDESYGSMSSYRYRSLDRVR